METLDKFLAPEMCHLFMRKSCFWQEGWHIP